MSRHRTPPPDPADVVFRPLQGQEEYRACVELQELTWGVGFHERVPPSMLLISQKVGGTAAGAFDADGKLLGFVYGLTGTRDGRLVHWSHMLAVRPEAQGVGLGRRLKLYQRESLLLLGVETMHWTYDPLVARNAHLNFNRLGVTVVEYVPNLYGPDTASELHSGLGTDRFIVEWDLAASRVDAIVLGSPPAVQLPQEAPVLSAGPDADAPLPTAPVVGVEIPAEIHGVLAEDADRAWAWRAVTRRAFTFYLDRGYRVQGFAFDAPTGRGVYVVTRGSQGTVS